MPCVACGSCNEKSEVHAADHLPKQLLERRLDVGLDQRLDERMDEPTPEVRTAYERVRRAVSKIGRRGMKATRFSPAIPEHRVACAVDEGLRLHVLRLPPTREPFGTGRSQPLEYAVIEGDDESPPTWRTLAQIHGAEGPELSLRGRHVVGGVLGTLTPQDRRDELHGVSFLLFPVRAKGEALPTVCIKLIYKSGHMTVAPDGQIFVISQEYDDIDIPRDVNGIGLRIYSCRSGKSRPFALEVPGSLHAKSFPDDYAIRVGADGDVHIVYEGIRGDEPRAKKRLWHVTLDAAGALRSEIALGSGVEDSYLTEIFAGPDAQMYMLEIYTERDQFDVGPWVIEHRVIALNVADSERGPAASFFIDPWLRVHAVWFDAGEPRYYGPIGPPE
jgi:hypothetical protein